MSIHKLCEQKKSELLEFVFRKLQNKTVITFIEKPTHFRNKINTE